MVGDMGIDTFIELLKKEKKVPEEAIRKETHNGKVRSYVIPIENELEEIANYHFQIFNNYTNQENYELDKEKVHEMKYRLNLVKETIIALKQGRIGGTTFKPLWSNGKNNFAPNEAKTNVLNLRYNNLEKDLRKNYISWKRQQNAKFSNFFNK